MEFSVAVRRINREGIHVIAEATNGSDTGPPLIRFNVHPDDISRCYIGKQYILTIEEKQ